MDPSGFNKTERRYLDTLRRRLDFLEKRVWDSAQPSARVDWDRSEAAAIRWALGRITGQGGSA